MNSLSLMIYASNIVEGVRDISATAGVIAAMAGIPVTIFNVVAHVEADENLEFDKKLSFQLNKWTKILWTTVIAASLLVIITPKKETILLIAASETASTVVTSTAGKEILDDTVEVIRGWLKEQKKTK